VEIGVRWPKWVAHQGIAPVEVALVHRLDRPAEIEARIPLPAGATLAEETPGVQQVDGVLRLRRVVGAGVLADLVSLPIRFHLRGEVATPEAEAALVAEEGPSGRAPAGRLQILARPP
jgi:hypothetical protein